MGEGLPAVEKHRRRGSKSSDRGRPRAACLPLPCFSKQGRRSAVEALKPGVGPNLSELRP